MKTIVEANIPFIRGLLEPFTDVCYLAPEQITPEAVRQADALITRTRTRCDSALLDGSQCRFIATATIGTDHIDVAYCADRGITVANAPGCNAPAVAQYVLATILSRYPDPAGLTVGVVGVGHVGSIVARWAEGLGCRVMPCDPPRAHAEGSGRFVSLDAIAAEADVITFHTPMTRIGRWPTYHMADRAFFASLRHRPLVINSARGPVADTAALLSALEAGTVGDAAIDCWENEPDISRSLLERAFVATPHIAGYSLEGKKRATQMAVDAFCRHFGFPAVTMADPAPAGCPDAPSADAILASYTPAADTRALKADPSAFEALRNGYSLRHEVK